MISFDALPGNRSLKASLRRALAGRIPQTVLLSGDDTRGLETLSTVLAAGILCEADGPRPCGVCLSCRKVQDGVHPDLTLIDEGEDELKVDLARRIKAENAIIPNDGARRVTIIRHAHNMNAAQGARRAAAFRVFRADLGKAGRTLADCAQSVHALRA